MFLSLWMLPVLTFLKELPAGRDCDSTRGPSSTRQEFSERCLRVGPWSV